MRWIERVGGKRGRWLGAVGKQMDGHGGAAIGWHEKRVSQVPSTASVVSSKAQPIALAHNDKEAIPAPPLHSFPTHTRPRIKQTDMSDGMVEGAQPQQKPAADAKGVYDIHVLRV